MTPANWAHLELKSRLLEIVKHTLEILEGNAIIQECVDGSVTAYGLFWNVLRTYEHLLKVLENAKNYEVNNQWQAAVNRGYRAWEVLDKYYQVLDECPACYVAMALYPAWRWDFFTSKWHDRLEWISTAKSKIKDLWKSEYKRRPVATNQTAFKPTQLKATFTSPFDPISDFLGPPPSLPLAPDLDDSDDFQDDEYERWEMHTTVDNWWIIRSNIGTRRGWNAHGLPG